jgi:hypothetical protein
MISAVSFLNEISRSETLTVMSPGRALMVATVFAGMMTSGMTP